VGDAQAEGFLFADCPTYHTQLARTHAHVQSASWFPVGVGGGGGVADGIRLPLVVRGSWDSGGGCHKLVDIYDPHKGVAVAIFDGVLCASLKREPADGRGRGFFGLVIVPVRPS